MSKCPRYNDSPQCTAGSAGNKTCAHCDHNSAGYKPAPAEIPAIPYIKISSEERIKAAMDKILKIFESDNLEIITRAVFKVPEGAAYSKPSDNWSFLNRIMMLIEDTEDARGFNQWKDAGRQVMKGSKAIYIFAPMMKKIEDEKTGEEKHILYGFKAVPVFRYEDTEGEDIPQAPKFNLELPVRFDGIIAELGLTVKAMAFNGGFYGYYSQSKKVIALCTPEIKTFLHELSHAVDDKLSNGKLKGGQHNDQEVVAEFSGAVIGCMMGYKIPLGNCKQYIEGYSFREMLHNLNRCEKVIRFIMDRTTTGAPVMIPAGEVS